MATRDYRSAAYRDAILNELDPVTGLPGRQTGASYSMAPPSWGQDGAASGASSFDDLTANYQRRNEGAGGVWSGAGKGAMIGLQAGKYLGPVGAIPAAAGGALIGGIAGAFTKNAKSAMTDFSQADARDAVANAYRAKMGRDAGQDEITTQLRNVGWQDGDKWVGEMGLKAIIDSLDPANDQRAAAATAGATGTGAAAGSASPVSSPGTAAPTGSGQYTGGSGALVDPYQLPAESDLEGLLANANRYGSYDADSGRIGAAGTGLSYANAGFDFGQDAANRDLGKSAKYAFSHLANQAASQGAPMPRTKAEAEAWFSQYIAPGLQQLGYEIGWVKGDKARIKTREGWDEIDFVGNAGGDNPTLTWQSEVLAPGGEMSTGAMGTRGSSVTGGVDLTSSALFDQLLRQVQDIAAGRSNGALVTDTNALLNLLAP